MIVRAGGKTYVESFNDAIPEVFVTKEENDTCVYGVLSEKVENSKKSKKTKADEQDEKESKDVLIAKLEKENKNIWRVNALGEGLMSVVQVDDKIPKNGDLLTSSRIPGYATAQKDDVFHSYTIAKVTQDINWTNVRTKVKYKNKSYKTLLVAVTYHCG
jgi:hypothetical protein